MSAISESIMVELSTSHIYPGFQLKTDGYDEFGNLLISKNIPVTNDLIRFFHAQKINKIRYVRQSFEYKQHITNPIISEPLLKKGIGLTENTILSIHADGSHCKLPIEESLEFIDDLILEFRKNTGSFLNLLELHHEDDYDTTHPYNVTALAILIGESLKLDDEKLQLVGLAGFLHDIGKAIIPSKIVRKPHELSEEEWKVMRNHPVYSYNILQNQEKLPVGTDKIVLCHHEEYNGGGYPFGTNYEKQIVYSQILQIADVFDALTSKRHHKEKWENTQALYFLKENSGKKFHPSIIKAFQHECIRRLQEEPIYPENALVYLNTGEIGIIDRVESDPYSLYPNIRIFAERLSGKTYQKIKPSLHVDMSKDKDRFIHSLILDEETKRILMSYL